MLVAATHSADLCATGRSLFQRRSAEGVSRARLVGAGAMRYFDGKVPDALRSGTPWAQATSRS